MHAEIATSNPETETNKAGVFGLVLSIIGVCLCGFWLLTIPGLILSLIGLRKEPRTAAITGSVLGGLGILEFLILGPLLLGAFLPAVARAREYAAIGATTEQIKFIQYAAEEYKTEKGTYPTSFAALEKDSFIGPDRTKDKWDTEFKFEGGGDTRPIITSAGRDKEFGTDDDLPKADSEN